MEKRLFLFLAAVLCASPMSLLCAGVEDSAIGTVKRIFSYTDQKKADPMSMPCASAEDSVIGTVKKLFSYADQKRFDKIGNEIFADKVLLDFKSMSGAEPTVLNGVDIAKTWEAMLPGFYSTHHQVGQFNAWVKDDKAKVQCRGLALHYLPRQKDGDFWVVVGSYDFELVKDGMGWRISKEKFNLLQQIGNTALASAAMQNVKNGICFEKKLPDGEACKAVEKYFDSLEKKNIKEFMTVWGRNPVQRMPLSPEGFPVELNGTYAIYNQYKGLPENFKSMRFPKKIFPTLHAGMVIVQYSGIIILKDEGEYNNNYVGVFETLGGKIVRFTEYFDPFILSESFGKRLGSSFNVNDDLFPEKATFMSEGIRLCGHLFLPKSKIRNYRYPAVLVTGSWTTVKEQMADLYAKEIAERGYAAFTFDFRGFGESDGTPRNYESPEKKIRDIQNALQYLASRKDIDGNKLYGLGICASAGYMAGASVGNTSIKKIALVAPWLHNAAIVKLAYGGGDVVSRLIATGRNAKSVYSRTGEIEAVPMASRTDTRAPLFGEWDYYLNPMRGAIKQWDNKFALMSWEDWLTFDGVKIASDVRIPVFIIHSQNAAVPMGAEQFYKNLTGTKKIVWTSGAQFDFYDRKNKVDEAVENVLEWFVGFGDGT